jgi:hypothetical protein
VKAVQKETLILVLLLLVGGAGIICYKHFALHFPFRVMPDQALWQVEASLEIDLFDQLQGEDLEGELASNKDVVALDSKAPKMSKPEQLEGVTLYLNLPDTFSGQVIENNFESKHYHHTQVNESGVVYLKLNDFNFSASQIKDNAVKFPLKIDTRFEDYHFSSADGNFEPLVTDLSLASQHFLAQWVKELAQTKHLTFEKQSDVFKLVSAFNRMDRQFFDQAGMKTRRTDKVKALSFILNSMGIPSTFYRGVYLIDKTRQTKFTSLLVVNLNDNLLWMDTLAFGNSESMLGTAKRNKK